MFIDEELVKDIYNQDWFEVWEKNTFPNHARTGRSDMKDQELCCTITAIVIERDINDTSIVKDLLDDPVFIEDIREKLVFRKLQGDLFE